MTSAARKPDANQSENQSLGQSANQPVRSFFLSKFFLGLLVLAITLLAIGIGGFLFLFKSGPLSLSQGVQRPVAAATVFVPANAPFTLSLLTNPDKLVAWQQAIATTPRTSKSSRSGLDPQQRNHREIEQLKQSLLAVTGLDYDRDLKPWMGDEVTFAFTDTDLDKDDSNAQQSGYLLAIEIAPAHQQQAREFLQLFWQRQSLADNPSQSEQISGVRVLYSNPQSRPINRVQKRPSALTAASALVGDRFVIFANDVRVLRQSIRAAQATTNLAQNRAYRQAVAQLPDRKIALAYVDMTILNRSPKATQPASISPSASDRQASHQFAAIGLGITKAGITADIRQAATTARMSVQNRSVQNRSVQNRSGGAAPEFNLKEELVNGSLPTDLPIDFMFIDALKFLPANSALALSGHQLAQLEPALAAVGVPESALPVVFQLEQPSPMNSGTTLAAEVSKANSSQAKKSQANGFIVQDWATADYALAQMNTGKESDWILAVAPDLARRADGVARLDAAAQAKGYSAIPIDIEGRKAIAWTRLSANARGRSSAALETEILGLHLQQDSYEVFAGSLAAMESAIAAPSNSLLKSNRFAQAIANLTPTSSGYLYADWAAIKPALIRNVPALNRLEGAARPLVAHIDTLAATREGESASVFIRLKP
jgi:hypothetical protein